MLTRDQMYFFADTTVNIRPDGRALAEIARQTAQTAREFGVTPRVAFVSYSNFGTARGPGIEEVRGGAAHPAEGGAGPDRRRRRCRPTRRWCPGVLSDLFPFSKLAGGTANVLIFPVLEAANAAYKLVQRLGGAEQIGPILQGMAKPVHVLQPQSEMNDILNMTAIAVVEAGMLEEKKGR